MSAREIILTAFKLRSRDYRPDIGADDISRAADVVMREVGEPPQPHFREDLCRWADAAQIAIERVDRPWMWSACA